MTRARVDVDRDDPWIETLDPDLTGLLVALAAALGSVDDAERDAARCARALARLGSQSTVSGMPVLFDATRTTLLVAQAVARFRSGEIGFDRVAPLVAGASAEASIPFHALVRALVGAVAANEARGEGARDVAVANARRLERAERVAAQTGTTLLDAAAATALGNFLVTESRTDPRALHVLDRAATLLAHGDAPSLEYEAEFARGLLVLGRHRWSDAIVHLRAAREAAHAERAGERELHATSIAVIAELAAGETRSAYESASALGDARLGAASASTAALGWVARALVSLSASDRDGAEDALAAAAERVGEDERRPSSAYVLVEIVARLVDAARGVASDGTASTLERDAESHAFEAFFWIDLLVALVDRLPEELGPHRMRDALLRLAPVLGRESRLARERRTTGPFAS